MCNSRLQQTTKSDVVFLGVLRARVTAARTVQKINLRKFALLSYFVNISRSRINRKIEHLFSTSCQHILESIYKVLQEWLICHNNGYQRLSNFEHCIFVFENCKSVKGVDTSRSTYFFFTFLFNNVCEIDTFYFEQPA